MRISTTLTLLLKFLILEKVGDHVKGEYESAKITISQYRPGNVNASF